MDGQYNLVVHPGHFNGSDPDPAPLHALDPCEVTTDSMAERLVALQSLADYEADHLKDWEKSPKFAKTEWNQSGLAISADRRFNFTTQLSPYFAQFAHSTLGRPVKCPPAGGVIIGVIAFGCPPTPSSEYMRRLHEVDQTSDTAVWILLVVINEDFPGWPFAGVRRSLMCSIANKLSTQGYIRNDLQECFQFREQIGKGSFAEVHRVVPHPTLTNASRSEQMVAKKLLSQESATAVASEVSYLLAVNSHPNVVKFMGLFCSRRSGWTVLLERCNAGDLKDYVRIHPDAFGEKAGLKVVGEGLFKALAYIHDIDILHRDVKAENVGLHHPPGNNIPDRACLMDFGIACHMSESERINSRCGSPGSIAPEVIIHANQSPKADVFGGGVALFYALGEQVPFEKGDLKTTLKRNARAIIKFNERLRQMANGTQELLRSLLLRNPQVRPTAVEAIASIKKLVEGLPSRHGGNEDEPNPEPPLLRESTQPPRVINVPPLDNAPNETCQMVFLPLPGHLKPLSPQASPPLRRRPVLHPVKFLSTPASPPSMQEDCANDDAVESRTCRRKRPQSAGVTLYQPMATGQTLRSSEVVTKP